MGVTLGWEWVGGTCDSPSLSCPSPHCHPQKLKDEIEDVFAQIDCFETTEER